MGHGAGSVVRGKDCPFSQGPWLGYVGEGGWESRTPGTSPFYFSQTRSPNLMLGQ